MITRASKQEIKEYDIPVTNLYPLYGWVLVGKERCAIELLRKRDASSPRYEVLAPDGKMFSPDCVHSLICFTLEEVKERCANQVLIDEVEQ